MDAMTTGFAIQLGCVRAFDLDCQQLVTGALIRSFRSAGQSTELVGEAQIGGGEFGHEETGIGTTFGGPDFDDTLGHDVLCVRRIDPVFPA